MCRTIHAVITAVICFVQAMVRIFMTMLLLLENLVRMILQTVYNFVSFLLQLISLIPICCVFLLTSRMKCFMCGGGGPCPVNRGGACDCLMSLMAIIVLFLIFRATGVLDKIFYSIGYAKATTRIARFSPTTGSVTECTRNATGEGDYYGPLDVPDSTPPSKAFLRNLFEYYDDELLPKPDDKYVDYLYDKLNKQEKEDGKNEKLVYYDDSDPGKPALRVDDNKALDYEDKEKKQESEESNEDSLKVDDKVGQQQADYALTTILYYLA